MVMAQDTAKRFCQVVWQTCNHSIFFAREFAMRGFSENAHAVPAAEPRAQTIEPVRNGLELEGGRR
jgi:hypothetical protein